MKKVLLALTLVFSTASFAQNAATVKDHSQLNPELQADVSEVQQVMSLVKKRNAVQKAKTAGGVINKRTIGFADTLYSFYGGSAVFGGLFQVPIYQDSTLRQEFSNTTTFIDQHGIGATYDPASAVWGQYAFAEIDPVTIDSLHLLGKYASPTSIANPTGDSLIVEVAWAPKGSLTGTFNTVFFPSNATNPDTCFIETPTVDVTTAGGSWKLAGANRIRKGIALDASDVIASTDPARLYSVAINQTIPAGNLVAVMFRFKSAYTGTVSVGDTFFSTVDADNANIPNFAARVAQEQPFSGTRFFCDPAGFNTTGVLDKSTLYQTNSSAFLNEIMFPTASSGYWVYYTVSGTSHFGVEENMTKTDVEIYPNPTTGMVNLAISQGGTYNLEVINLLGQVVHAEEVSVSGNGELKRDFSGFAKGIYLVNIKGDNFTHTSKLTISK